MTSTLGGDDPRHDLSKDEKDRLEEAMRREARDAKASARERTRVLAQAGEISRRKAKRAHQS
jgi:hypothetical protein